ncbi:MAG TPA: GntR family transcriptional regulator [Eubacteriaceae bacterium]|nr:GntR family transcriptional regulator [Eubacteriaceae bacterium]
MSWNLDADRPIYSQLMDHIKRNICSKSYLPGSKIPSVRELARDASVNPNTMQKALAKLEEEGLIYTNRTSGRFVTEDKQMIQEVKNTLAKEHIESFLENMTLLGFEDDETLDFIQKEMNLNKEEPNGKHSRV